MGMAIGGKGGQTCEINVTPLIDVLLVLLIIFMVITPVVPKGLQEAIPQPRSDTGSHPARTIVSRAQPGGLLWINNEPVTMEMLGPRLAEIFKSRAERVAFVEGDS